MFVMQQVVHSPVRAMPVRKARGPDSKRTFLTSSKLVPLNLLQKTLSFGLICFLLKRINK